MQEIGTRYSVEIEGFLRDMQKVSDVYGEVDQRAQNLRKTNPFAQAATASTQVNKALGQQIQTYQRVEAVAASFRKEQDRISKASDAITKAQNELAAANRYGQLKQQIGQVESALERMNTPLKEADSWWEKLKAKFSRGLKVPKIDIPKLPGADEVPTGDTSTAKTSLKDRLKGLFGKGGSTDTKTSTTTAIVDELAGQAGIPLSGGKLGMVATVAATATAVIQGTKAWSEYSEKLSEVSALTGATGKSLEFLDEQAKQIEKDTGIAGTQILEAFKSIAGIKPELLESKEALAQTTKEVVTLSQASKLSLEDSAKALLGSLSQFDEGADQAARFSNVLAAGAKLGNSEINDTADALKNSGTAMKAAGLSFEQGNALLQVLAGKMIKGSEAGTALRNVLLKLEIDTDKNLRPSIVGLDKALENAAKKYDTTAERAKVFGTENIVAASQVLDASKEVAKMTDTLTGTSVAYEQAMTNTDNLATDLKKAGTSITGFFRDLASSQDGFLRFSVQAFTNFLHQLTDKKGEFQAFFGSLFDGKGGVLSAFRDAAAQRQANILAEQRRIQNQTVRETAAKNVGSFIKTRTDSLIESGVSKNDAGVQAAEAATLQAQAKLNQVRKQYNDTASALRTANGEQRKRLIQDGKLDALAIKQARENLDVANSALARAKKDKQTQADALKKALGEPATDAQKAAGKKAKEIENENARLLLDAKKDYEQEALKLEQQFGKERLQQLDKDGAEYINGLADLAQQELKLQRDAIEKKLQLAKSEKTAVVNGKRQVVADTSVTLENSAPALAAQFAQQQQQIEQQRQRDLELGRIRQEYKLLELARQSGETEVKLFDKQWEEKLTIERKNAQQYLDYTQQYQEARQQIIGVYSADDLAAFDAAWKKLIDSEKSNAAVYLAMIEKRNRDRNSLVVGQIIGTSKDQEAASLAFVDQQAFENQLKQEKANSLGFVDIEFEREKKRLQIRIDAGKRLIDLLKEQGERENSVVIAQTQAMVDGLEKQQAGMSNLSGGDGATFFGKLLGLGGEDLERFKMGLQAIGNAVQETTQLIIDQSNQRIQALDAEIQAKQSQIETEEQRSKEGYANNLALRQAELNDLQAQKAREEAIRRQAVKKQQELDLISTTSTNIATTADLIATAAKAMKGVVGIPFVGIFLAIAAAASIYATIASFRAKTKALTKLKEGGRIDLSGRSHEHGGHRIEGTDIEVERGEHVINARSSEQYDKTLEAINKNNPLYAIQMLAKEGRIGLPEVVIQYIRSPEFAQPMPQAGFNDKRLASLEAKFDVMIEHMQGVRKNTVKGKQYIGTPDDHLEIDGDNKSRKMK